MTAPGTHAVGLHRLGQRDLHREQRRLHAVDAGHRLRRRHGLGDREPGLRGDQRLHLGDGRGEDRLGGQQVRAHPGPLRALPENTHTGPRSSWPTAGSIRHVAVGDVAQGGASSPRCAAMTAVAHRPVRAPARQGVGQVGERDVVGRAASTQSASRPAVHAQLLGGRRRQREQQRRAASARSLRPVAVRRCCAGACSRTACTLVPDIPYDDTAARRGWSPLAATAWCPAARKVRLDRGDLVGQPGEVQVLRDRRRAAARGSPSSAQRPGRRTAGGRSWSSPTPSAQGPSGAVNRCEAGVFDRIADRGAGAVRLDQADAGRGRRRPPPAPPGRPRPARRSDGVAMLTVRPSWLAAVPRTTARTRSPSRRASASRLSTSTTTALAGDEPVGVDVERMAAAASATTCPAASRRRTCAVRASTATPPASGEVALAVVQAAARQVHAIRPDEQAVSTVSAGPCSPERVGRPARRRS